MSHLTQRFTWEYPIPVLTNRFFLFDTLKIVVFGSMFLAVIFAPVFLSFQGLESWPILYQFLGALTLILVGLGFVTLLLVAVLYRNHLRAQFSLTEEGAEYQVLSQPAQWLTYVLLVITILTGRIGDAGMSLLVTAQAKLGIRWRDVYRVKEHPEQQVITLLNNWRVVLRLYCRPENYDEVAALVRSLAAQGEVWRADHHLKPGRVFSARLIFLTLLTLSAALFLSLIPFSLNPAWATGVLIGALVLIWLPGWSRLFGSLTLIGAVALLNLILLEGFKITRSVTPGAQDTPPDLWIRQYGFQSLVVSDWIHLSLAIISLSFLIWLAVGAVRGSLYRK